jgi:hypothetical protein
LAIFACFFSFMVFEGDFLVSFFEFLVLDIKWVPAEQREDFGVEPAGGRLRPATGRAYNGSSGEKEKGGMPRGISPEVRSPRESAINNATETRRAGGSGC